MSAAGTTAARRAYVSRLAPGLTYGRKNQPIANIGGSKTPHGKPGVRAGSSIGSQIEKSKCPTQLCTVSNVESRIMKSN